MKQLQHKQLNNTIRALKQQFKKNQANQPIVQEPPAIMNDEPPIR